MRLIDSLKDSFVKGLLLIAPLVITLYILRLLVGWALLVVNPVVQGTGLTRYTANDALLARVVAALLIVTVIVVLGYLAKRTVGKRLFGSFGRVVNLVPLVDTIYSSIRQVANSLVERDSSFQSVVLVEYPMEDVYAVGFVTGEDHPAFKGVREGESLVTVFLPNSPNPTGGRLAVVPEAAIHEVDMSVRRGLRFLVTTGIGDEQVPEELTRRQSRSEPT
jgi:uncharacterized membrane protein